MQAWVELRLCLVYKPSSEDDAVARYKTRRGKMVAHDGNTIFMEGDARKRVVTQRRMQAISNFSMADN